MARRNRVYVEAQDFMLAIRNRSGRCAVKRAVKRAFPEASRVMVDIQTIRMTINGERLIWITPPPCQDVIVWFDAGEFSRLQPFNFALRKDAAVRVARATHPSEADRQRANKAKREGRSEAGVNKARREKNLPKAARRSMGGADRSYGARNLSINQAREKDGLIGAVEAVPS